MSNTLLSSHQMVLDEAHQQQHAVVILRDGTVVETCFSTYIPNNLEVRIDGTPVLSFTPTGRTRLRGLVGNIPPDINIPLPIFELVPMDVPHGSVAFLTTQQLWASLYGLWVTPEFVAEESLFISLVPSHLINQDELHNYLLLSGLAHPRADIASPETDLVLSRLAFWQGAGAPPEFNWVNDAPPKDWLQSYPLVPKATFNGRVATTHPNRQPKPKPGETVYVRYIPSLGEMLTFIALDAEDEVHFEAFHKWQNDPRVSQGWNESGDRKSHKKYLQQQMRDPHSLSVIACWDRMPFGYFEFTWTREDHISPHVGAMRNEWARGYHVLVGEERFLGSHRFVAWSASIDHYLFLSDPRTQRLEMEPKTGSRIIDSCIRYLGYATEKDFNFPHKRSTLTTISRERFFQQPLL